MLKVGIFSYLKDYYNIEVKWYEDSKVDSESDKTKNVRTDSAEDDLNGSSKDEKVDRHGETWLIPKVTNRITIWIQSYYAETQEEFEKHINTPVGELVPESAKLLQKEELWGKGINYVRIDHFDEKIEVRFL